MQLLKFKVQGMHSAVDVISIERILKNIDGVDAVEINIVNSSVKVRHEEQLEITALKEAIEKCGYVFIEEQYFEQVEEKTAHKKLKKKSILLAVLAAVNVLLMVLLYLASKNIFHLEAYLVPAMVAMQAAIGLGMLMLVRREIADGWKKLLNSHPCMDGFVAVGLTVAGLYSIICTGYFLAGFSKFISNIYFAPMSLIICFWSFGEYKLVRLQQLNGSDEKSALEEPIPVQLIKGSELIEITSDMVFADDLIYLTEKDIVPMNGTVVSGEASVDESQVNGISIPVVKRAGAVIYAGSRITGGDLNFKAAAAYQPVGRRNKFGTVDLLSYASESKKAASFIPAVLVIAVTAGFNWLFYTKDINFAMNILVSVLLLSSPCFYKIAVAMPFYKAMRKAADGGICFGSLQALIDAANISTVIFGKTGTLTRPNIIITDIHTFNGVNKNAAICLAASLESRSSHPVAEALKNIQTENLMEFSSLNYAYGRGVSAVYQNVKVHLGFGQYIEKLCSIPAEIRSLAEEQEEAGHIAVYLAAGKYICALFILAEEISAADTGVMEKIHQQGLRTIMLSGDKSIAVERVSKLFGIQKFMTDLTVEEKYDLLKSIKQGGEKVAVISNNLCDRLLSECADISICFYEKINELANIVFKKHDLNLFLETIEISKAMQNRIKSNTFLSMLLCSIFLPLGCGVLYYFSQLTLEPIHLAGLLLINGFIILLTAL